MKTMDVKLNYFSSGHVQAYYSAPDDFVFFYATGSNKDEAINSLKSKMFPNDKIVSSEIVSVEI